MGIHSLDFTGVSYLPVRGQTTNLNILKYTDLNTYLDDTRKKYFRVQANHIAPAGSQYSREAIKRKKIDDEVRMHIYIPLRLYSLYLLSAIYTPFSKQDVN